MRPTTCPCAGPAASPGPRLRRWSRVLVLLVAAVLLPGCMQVPDSGPVLAGPDVGAEEEPVLQYVPGGPRPGAGPAEVVHGYLDAMRAYPPNPGIVRQFLTREAAGSWSPGAGTAIYTDRPEVEQLGRAAVRIDTPLLARLTERGAWEAPEPQERLRQTFRLRRERGQWRIANPAAGLLIPDYDFERYYEAYALYFFDPALRVLVPDLVHLPEGDQTATLLLRGLSRGPTAWLRGAVESIVPSVDRADVAVPVSDDGVAHVQLGSTARGLGAAERKLLAAQLSWTLRQVPDVDAVRVSVSGAPLAVGGEAVVEGDFGADFDPADSAAAQALFALRGDQVMVVDPVAGTGTKVPGRFGTGDVPVSGYAVERSGKTIAAVTRRGTSVEVAPIGAAASRPWLTGARSLLGVQWDIHGLLWSVDRTPQGPVVRVLRNGRVARVPLGGDAPDDIRAFALARDGMRIAVISGGGASARLLLGRIRRPAADSLAVRVDRWREVEPVGMRLRRHVDVAWGSPTELTVVAHEARSTSEQTFTVSVDGSAVEPAALVDLDLVSVADAPDANVPPVVETRPGSLYVQLSDRWSALALDGAFRQPSYAE